MPYSTVAREAVETFGVVRVEDRGKKGGDLDGVRAICQSNGSDTQFTVSLMYDSGMSPRHREVFDAMRTQAR